MLEYQNEGPMASQDTDDPDDDSSKYLERYERRNGSGKERRELKLKDPCPG